MKKRTKAPSQRQLQAGALIRRALVDILAREDFRDPDLFDVSVTISEVRTTPDLKHARVYAAPLGGKNSADVIAALNRASKFLRGKLGRELSMRSTPALRFEEDTIFQQASDLQELLNLPEIARDLKADQEK
ncbi:MAG: 30S ribosome-binding factor RbfA [Robiginitomaculum sp.]